MKFFVLITGFFCTLFALPPTVLCAAPEHGFTASLPACGIICFLKLVEKSSCSPTDTTCICEDEGLISSIDDCFSANCTIKQSLTMQNYTVTLCGIEPHDRTGFAQEKSLGSMGFLIITFTLRILGRLSCFDGEWGWDDTVMGITILLYLPLAVLSWKMGTLGLGIDMWAVPFENITKILYYYFWSEELYHCILGLTKISILLFYLRIFRHKPFRIVTWVLIGLNAAYVVSLSVATVVQCKPVDGAWEHWDGGFGGQCSNLNVQGWVSTAVNLTFEITTLLLPLRELWKLKLSTHKKIGVCAMFCVGFFATIVSMVRLRALVQLGASHNITWDYMDVGIWSVAEIFAGILCACMPAIRSFFRNLIRRYRAFRSDNASGQGGRRSSMPTFGFGSKSTIVNESHTQISIHKPDDSFVHLVELEKGMGTGRLSVRNDSQNSIS